MTKKTTKTNFTVAYFVVLAICLIAGVYYMGFMHGSLSGFMIGNIYATNSTIEDFCYDSVGKTFNTTYINDVCLFEINSSQPTIYIADCGIIKFGFTEKPSLIQKLQVYVYTRCKFVDKVNTNEYI